jgi:quercetin 2,3-dioxygenase
MTTTTINQREAAVVSDPQEIRVMGFPVREALPAPEVPYEISDPFILVHESTLQISQMANVDTQHPHRGFDNLWYVIKGSASTGHTTGPGGAFERARLPEGSLLHVRTGRGVIHAEKLGDEERQEGHGDSEFRGVLFWVNLARKDKAVDPTATVLQADEMPLRSQGDATIRVMVGEGSRLELGTPALLLDVVLNSGGAVSHQVPREFQGFAYLLEGGATFGANRAQARAGQLVLMGSGESFGVQDATPGTRYLLMAGKPYGETPRFNGPFVD